MTPSLLRIATRQSPLALWQAHFVKQMLHERSPELTIQLVPIVTQGDIILDTPLAKIGGKGLFIKELEVALLENQADIAVHSMKDLPMDLPDGLQLTAICKREDPTDAFVSNHYKRLEDLPEHAIVGTSSLRRQCQLKAVRPDLQIKDLRGNVGTRLSKLDQGEYDAIILATAGLKRLQLEERIRYCIDPSVMLPAVGQGAVGIESRIDDIATNTLLETLNDVETAYRVHCERAMNHCLMGGCQVPIGSFAEIKAGELYLRALVGEVSNGTIIFAEGTSPLEDGQRLGESIAKELLDRGAQKLLDLCVD